MRMYERLALAFCTVVAIGAGTAGSGGAADVQRHVVGADEIQAAIDQQASQADADRQAVEVMLQRADVRQLAGAAGLDLKRASAGAALLTGPALQQLAAQARAMNTDLAGGDTKIVVSATAVIIALLILILLAS